MRSFVSAMLLFLQVEPVAGVAFCHVLAAGDPDRMEAGCPMPDSQRPAPAVATGEANASPMAGSTLGALDPPHDCVLAEVCLVTTPALLPSPVAFALVPPPSLSGPCGSEPVQGVEHPAPPVPPPNS
jgi:hypothetical protein